MPQPVLKLDISEHLLETAAVIVNLLRATQQSSRSSSHTTQPVIVSHDCNPDFVFILLQIHSIMCI